MAFCLKFCCSTASDRKETGKKGGSWRIFSLKELHSATNNFNYDNKLGEGGFGSVYWGQLWDGSQFPGYYCASFASILLEKDKSNLPVAAFSSSVALDPATSIVSSASFSSSTKIAVKRLKVWSSKAELEFAVEVEILGRVRHKNLLSLRGYCVEGQERLIVYDYMPNLSLLSHLHGQHSTECLLDWSRRMAIAVGSAEGIAYLHHHATPHIIHRDIKASNVLLDSDFKAQVADFGFAKLIPDGATHVTTRVKGTLGYLAPEYAMFGKASESCDVYSFGILLLELVSGKKPIEKLSATMKRTVVDWALPLVREREFDEVADPKLNGKYVGEELRRVVLVALLCAQSRPEMRPTMHEAVDMLKGESKEVVLNLENHELFRQDQAGSCQEGAYEFISEEKDPKQDLNEAAAAGSVVS